MSVMMKAAASFISESTKVIDLKGKMVVPGFIDGHTHEVSNIIDENNLIFFEQNRNDNRSISETVTGLHQ